MNITAAIVLYENDAAMLVQAINSCLASSLISKLYLIDNSETQKLAHLKKDERIEYIHNSKNIGFGAAHNIAIHQTNSTYHLILNPDISFSTGVIEQLAAFMEKHPDIGTVMPKILYNQGEIQRLCKLLPSPINLFGRRFAGASKWGKALDASYELSDFNYDYVLDVPNLSGCFMFVRTAILKKIGGFDTRYFMYLEDVDLVRRIGRHARTVFYPFVSIYHGYQKGSYANGKLMRIHIQSAIKYFNKWGWFIDSDRRKLNKITLDRIAKHKL
jgi:GT2 family glycosyltransferase